VALGPHGFQRGELSGLDQAGTTVPRSQPVGTKVLPVQDNSIGAVCSAWMDFPLVEAGLTLSAVHSYDGKLPHAGVAQW
jgi:hypothetical protein